MGGEEGEGIRRRVQVGGDCDNGGGHGAGSDRVASGGRGSREAQFWDPEGQEPSSDGVLRDVR